MSLAQKVGKHDAHDIVYEAAMEARHEGKSFFQLLANSEHKSVLFEEGEGDLHLKREHQFGLAAEMARDFGAKAIALRADYLAQQSKPAASLNVA
jgi:adenylosuccinate lyase